MSHINKKSLTYQVQETFGRMAAFGQSKHADKALHNAKNKIYSYSTMKAYLQHANYFVRFCHDVHRCKTIEECRPFADEWLQSRMDKYLSSSTLKLEVAALAKLYGTTAKAFITTPNRRRADIFRSRGMAVRDAHFSETNHREIVTFCKCTGLRRRELAAIKGTSLVGPDENGCYKIFVENGKGGKKRYVPVTGSQKEVQAVVELMKKANTHLVFAKVPSAMDVHSYRSIYANRIYKLHARPIAKIKNDRLILYHNRVVYYYDKHDNAAWFASREYYEDGLYKIKPGYRDVASVYTCRDDLRTVQLDRMAMLEASKALGHNREEIFAISYFRK